MYFGLRLLRIVPITKGKLVRLAHVLTDSKHTTCKVLFPNRSELNLSLCV